MNIDFEKHGVSSIQVYPQFVTEHLYFTIAGDACLVQTDPQKGFIKYPRNFIVGPQLVNDIVDLGKCKHIARISFRPGGLYRLLGIPMYELTDGLDLSLVLAKQSRDLSERLAGAADNYAAFEILESFLLQRAALLKPITPYDLAIAELVKHNGNISIRQAADWAALSIRQFERKSQMMLGVPPKLYARITRFSNACRYKQANPDKTWLQVTYEYGYADQMHLINDFKQFTGVNPESPEGRQALGVLSLIEGKR
ncbi:AraC family transcriptional regulator [Niabella sp. CC-SYL272]|uniref:helix-turn-helix domain-containing protein n=1 Tax=Niabella agricola TaxID=2891571 RepID=UPI001F25EB40|nr:AraC family transcriptional regulator [Niabella agricola]MCF3109562.1 AraC family transcriptional regulator [Niabella agricola]